MPTTDPPEFQLADVPIRWFPVLEHATVEAIAGNGIQSAGDFQVTATATDLELQVAAGTAVYQGATSSLASATTLTVTSGDSSDRWDTVVWDHGTASASIKTGTAGATPTPPTLSGDEVLLAVVYVESGATDVADSDTYNWRHEVLRAGDLRYDDSPGVYGAGTVDGALDELQEAAQVGSYPVANSDLANASVTVAGNSVSLGGSTDVAYPDLSDTGTSFPIPIGDLNTPFGLDDLTDTDLGSADLTAGGGATTLYDSTAGEFRREVLDDERTLTGPVTSNTTTSGEEVVLADTSGGALTVTLASADTGAGNVVTVVDVGGAAGSDAITVDTEGSETIDGASSTTIQSDYGAAVVVADGSNWFSAGGGSGAGGVVIEDEGATVADPPETINLKEALSATATADGVDVDADLSEFFGGEATANLSDTNQLIIERGVLADGEAIRVRVAGLTEGVGGAAPSGVTLDLVTFGSFSASPSFTVQSELIAGDGSTDFSRVTGDPIASYTNTTGSDQLVGILVDNQSGTNHELLAGADGVVS